MLCMLDIFVGCVGFLVVQTTTAFQQCGVTNGDLLHTFFDFCYVVTEYCRHMPNKFVAYDRMCNKYVTRTKMLQTFLLSV